MTSAPADTQPTADSGQQTGCYVYGILPGDAELTKEVHGVGDREVSLARSGEIAALVSEVDLAEPLGTPRDFQAHKELLDSIVTGAPVLPLRFGAVLSGEDAVVEELLDQHHDEFVEALEDLEGQLEYVVKGRYVERAMLQEVLSGNSGAAALRERIRGKDPDATREQRIRLGEIISSVVAAMRDDGTGSLLSRLEGHCTASFVRDPTHELDAVHVALLVPEHQADEAEQAVDDLAADWEGWIDVRLLGPMAPYDFVSTSQPGAELT
jgi:Gas vesicle synthesis protein GvpL/GvpF